jgi:hypothetical protein
MLVLGVLVSVEKSVKWWTVGDCQSERMSWSESCACWKSSERMREQSWSSDYRWIELVEQERFEQVCSV